MSYLDSTKKQRHYSGKKDPDGPGYGGPSGLDGCERWTVKKADCQRIDAFELWCWRRLLSPLDSKEIKPASLKGNQP